MKLIIALVNPTLDPEILNKRVGLTKIIAASEGKNDIIYEYYERSCALVPIK